MLSSTLLGGACFDEADAVDVDSTGNVWLAGRTDSNPFPQATPFESGPAYAQYKALVAEFDPGGDSLLFSSYVTSGNPPAIAADQSGAAWIGGSSLPMPLPASAPEAPALPTTGAGLLQRIGALPSNPLTIISVGNTFTARDGPLSAGEFTTIRLNGFQPNSPVDVGWSVPLPMSLAGAQVLFDGGPAAMILAVPGRIDCIAPYDLAGKASTVVQVRFGDQQTSTALRVDVVTADPGLLTADGSGIGQAYVRNQDGTLNDTDNPAPAGSTITAYVTGIGLADPGCPYGQIAPAGYTPPLTARTSFGGQFPVAAVPGMVCGVSSIPVTIPPNYGTTPNLLFSVLPAIPEADGGPPIYTASQTVTIAIRGQK